MTGDVLWNDDCGTSGRVNEAWWRTEFMEQGAGGDIGAWYDGGRLPLEHNGVARLCGWQVCPAGAIGCEWLAELAVLWHGAAAVCANFTVPKGRP